jgi:hypothetical protein
MKDKGKVESKKRTALKKGKMSKKGERTLLCQFLEGQVK